MSPCGEWESESQEVMTMQERIVARLTEALDPRELDIVDESDRHAGHAGVRSGPGHAQAVGGTHYRVRIVSAKFAGLNRVARHRLVYDLLPAEFADGLHALAVVAKAPGEP
jgi:BolA family transcriptional regulator, general stress-responsive regulator